MPYFNKQGRDERPFDRDDDEGKKRSWREIDARRDGSKHTSDQNKEKTLRPPKARAAYNKYKNELNRLFDSGEVGNKFGLEGKKNAFSSELKALKETSSQAEFDKLFSNFISNGSCPDDPFILGRAAASSNPDIAKFAIKYIMSNSDSGMIRGKGSLIQRVKTLAMISGDPELSELADKFKKFLGI